MLSRRFLCGFTFLMFLVLQCGYVFGSVRGIPVKIITKSGEKKEITLYSEYYALIVGCGKYKYWPQLSNPPRDAMQVARALRYLGFRTKVLLDPTSFQLKKALNELVATVGKKKDIGILFYFAGHGHTITEANGKPLGYIVPVDAPDPDRDLAGFIDKAISMRKIEEYTKLIQSKHVIMLFDSCFSGALFTLTRARPSQYIREKVSLPVREFITAGRDNEMVPDHSVFKQCFLIGVRDGDADLNGDGYITGEELGAYLQEHVVNYTSGSQHPQFGKIRDPMLDRGDFVFVPKDLYNQPERWQNFDAEIESSTGESERTKVSTLLNPSSRLPKSSKSSKPESKNAALFVETTPPGAKVYLDNKLLGKSPITVEGLSPGEGMIRIELEGYETKVKRLRFKESSTVELYAALKPVKTVVKNEAKVLPSAISKGILTVKTSPEDARVRILNIRPRYHDGIELNPGKYLIEVSKTGYNTVKRWIMLKAGENKEIRIKLCKISKTSSEIYHDVPSDATQTWWTGKGWLGVSIQDITPELAQHFGVNKGALVADLIPQGPAETAGIKRGDVILEFNGKTITDSLTLSRLVRASLPGTNATMLVLRDGKKLYVKVKIGAMK